MEETRHAEEQKNEECENESSPPNTIQYFTPTAAISVTETMSNHATEPLILQEMGCSYGDLCKLISRIPDMQSQPQEIVLKVTDFFRVNPVVPENVVALRASSHDERHPLEESLTPSTSTWWISGFGSMIGGKGEEWVEYELAKTVCRLSTFKIEIPPLPSGPLSVRALRLDCKMPD